MFGFTKKSSSFHTLNCDKKVELFEKKVWKLYNLINNNIPTIFPSNQIPLKNFICDIDRYWSNTEITSSPSRKISDLFWMNLPWSNIKEELGTIHVVDIGCGKGTYGKKIQKWSENRIDSYTGIDISPQKTWNNYRTEFGFNFFTGRAEKIPDYIEKCSNFFISQSALEHVELDLLFFQNLGNFLQKNQTQSIQIHLVPAESCLKLYEYHGVRQYSIRTLHNICKIFSKYSTCSIYKLGGNCCYEIHNKYITEPLKKGTGDLRMLQTSEYESNVKRAIIDDFYSENAHVNFYALIIHSFPRRDIL